VQGLLVNCALPGPAASLLITGGGVIISELCSTRPRSQPSDNGRWGHFPKILDLFQGLKIGVPSDCLGETSIFKIMIDDVTL